MLALATPAGNGDLLETQVLDAAAIATLDANAWDELSQASLGDNPFYSRQYFLAGLETVDAGTDVAALVVRAPNGMLVGFLPYRIWVSPPFVYDFAAGVTNIYAVAGMPLIHRAHAPDVVTAWFDAIRARREVPGFWSLPHVDLDAPAADLIRSLAETQGIRCVPIGRYERPVLSRLEGGFAAHEANVIAPSRRRELKRCLRRLAEQGTLSFESATEPTLVRERVEQFLELEAKGWKGEAGTSMLSDATSAEFARRAFAGIPGREGLGRVDTLLLDGAPIAISVNVEAADTRFTPKCAYDERFRRFSPGLVLEYKVLEAFYAHPTSRAMDAATTTEGHVVAGLWNRTCHMGTLIVGPADFRTNLLARLEEERERIKRAARRLLGKSRTRKEPLPQTAR